MQLEPSRLAQKVRLERLNGCVRLLNLEPNVPGRMPGHQSQMCNFSSKRLPVLAL
jgi:hypothetical protein